MFTGPVWLLMLRVQFALAAACCSYWYYVVTSALGSNFDHSTTVVVLGQSVKNLVLFGSDGNKKVFVWYSFAPTPLVERFGEVEYCIQLV